MFCVCYELTANFRKGVVESSFSFHEILTIRVSSEKNTILQTSYFRKTKGNVSEKVYIVCFPGFLLVAVATRLGEAHSFILLTDISDDHVCF